MPHLCLQFHINEPRIVLELHEVLPDLSGENVQQRKDPRIWNRWNDPVHNWSRSGHVRLHYGPTFNRPTWRQLEARVTLEKTDFGWRFGSRRVLGISVPAPPLPHTIDAAIHLLVPVQPVPIIQPDDLWILFRWERVRLQHKIRGIRSVHLLELRKRILRINHAGSIPNDRQHPHLADIQRRHHQRWFHLLTDPHLPSLARPRLIKHARQYDLSGVCFPHPGPDVQHRRSGCVIEPEP